MGNVDGYTAQQRTAGTKTALIAPKAYMCIDKRVVVVVYRAEGILQGRQLPNLPITQPQISIEIHGSTHHTIRHTQKHGVGRALEAHGPLPLGTGQ